MFHITYSAPRNLDDSIMAEMARVDQALSIFNPISEISAINTGKCFRAGPYVSDVFEISRQVSALSDGAFDPTVRPLVDLWGFGPGAPHSDTITPPAPEALDSALALVGIQDCRIAPDGAIAKKHPLTRFDFSAVAKGYGVDRVAEVLRRNGARNFMVEIGGEVSLQGLNPRGLPWHIRIEAPAESPDISRSLAVRAFGPEPAAIASSGNYRNFRTDSLGHRYGHTISPRTGRPAQSDVRASTVITRGDCARADALATAAMAMPSALAERMLRQAGVNAILLVADADSLKMIEIAPSSDN